jgi:WD40 repeat protein
MKWVRGLVAGVSLLLSLQGCSNKNDITNVVGSYAPVIVDIALNQPPALSPSVPLGYVPAVRDSMNQFTAVITNPGGITLKYHWTAAAGTLLDSTAASVRWRSPHAIGTYDITLAIEGTDTNGKSYYRVRTFHIYTDNAYVRWTRSGALQFDPAPRLDAGPPQSGPLLYSEFTNVAAGETSVFSVDGPEGSVTELTPTFFQASSPTLRADGAQFAFQGKKRSSDGGFSIYLLPVTGGDTTSARVAVIQAQIGNKTVGLPRFQRAGTLLMFHSDSTSGNNPKPWVRDVANFGSPPARLIQPLQQPAFTWWNSNWDGTGDSVVAESYRNFTTTPIPRGLFKIFALPPYQDTSLGFDSWLADSAAFEPDWSPDNQHIVFTRQNIGGDRDIWIIRADTNDKTQAVRVTGGPADDAHPRFSSDGSTIFFVSNRADRYGYNGLFGLERRGTNIWAVSRFDKP